MSTFEYPTQQAYTPEQASLEPTPPQSAKTIKKHK